MRWGRRPSGPRDGDQRLREEDDLAGTGDAADRGQQGGRLLGLGQHAQDAEVLGYPEKGAGEREAEQDGGEGAPLVAEEPHEEKAGAGEEDDVGAEQPPVGAHRGVRGRDEPPRAPLAEHRVRGRLAERSPPATRCAARPRRPAATALPRRAGRSTPPPLPTAPSPGAAARGASGCPRRGAGPRVPRRWAPWHLKSGNRPERNASRMVGWVPIPRRLAWPRPRRSRRSRSPKVTRNGASAHSGAVPGAARARHRARGDQPAGQGVRQGHLPLRGVRAGALLVGHEVRQPDRVAVLLRAARQRGGHHVGPELLHGAHRGALPALRRPPGPRLRRRPAAHRAALLHERRRAQVRQRG